MEDTAKAPLNTCRLLALAAATVEEHLARLRETEKLTGHLSARAAGERLQMVRVLVLIAQIVRGSDLPPTKRVHEHKDFLEKMVEKDLAAALKGVSNAR